MSVPVGLAAERAWAAQLLVGRAGEADALPAVKRSTEADGVVAAPAAVERAVNEINESLQGQSIGVRFEVDAETDRLVVKVVDRASGELIRQIPSEEVLRIAKLLGKIPGVLMSESA